MSRRWPTSRTRGRAGGALPRAFCLARLGPFAVAFAVAFANPPSARAQQPPAGRMPNLRDISGRPLPDRSLAAGIVTVRLANQTMASPVADAEIVAIVETPGGDSRKRTAKTDAEGRATFQGLPPGSRFHAEVTVAGDLVKTDTFTIPEVGGVRTMLIAGLPPAGAGAAEGSSAGDDGTAPTDDPGPPGAEAPRFSLGIISGTAILDAQLPDGTIRVTAIGQRGEPLGGQEIELGEVLGTGKVDVTRQTTTSAGTATFSGAGKAPRLPPPPEAKAGAVSAGAGGAAATGSADASDTAGSRAGAVVMSVRGVRFGTDGFSIPRSGGVRVELRVPATTADPSVIAVGAGGRIILQLRDDAIGFIETLPLVNPSGKIFDPGVGGIEIPLPSEAVNTEGAEGEHKIEIRKGIGVAVHGPIPPRRNPAAEANQKSPDEITFGYILPMRGAALKFEQRFPNGLGEFTFICEAVAGIGIESPQISGKQERELNGKKYWLMRGEPVPVGGTLAFKVTGLPVPDNTGKVVASVLSLALLLTAIVLSRHPARGDDGRPPTAGAPSRLAMREALTDRREKLFAELLAVEARRRERDRLRARGGAGAGDDPSASSASASAAMFPERDALIRKLENVYRDLAALDERRPG